MRKKRENGMAKESGMGDFPRKQFESVLLHSLRIMDQNREYLQMHLARTGDERTRQALEDMRLPELDWFMDHCMEPFRKNLDELQ